MHHTLQGALGTAPSFVFIIFSLTNFKHLDQFFSMISLFNLTIIQWKKKRVLWGHIKSME